jgi:hypothetical protein
MRADYNAKHTDGLGKPRTIVPVRSIGTQKTNRPARWTVRNETLRQSFDELNVLKSGLTRTIGGITSLQFSLGMVSTKSERSAEEEE